MSTAQDRLVRTVREYDAQGWHRTGSRVDNDSADWLSERIGEIGFTARLESFEFDRVIPGDSYVEIANDRITGFPIFDGSFTGDAGVSGVLCMGGSVGDIALVKFPPAGAADDVQAWRVSGDYSALIGVVPLGEPGMAIRNAEYFHSVESRSGAPVIQVSRVEYERLKLAAESEAIVRVVAQAAIEKSTAQNIIVEVAGSDSSLAPLVVMTPRSGWFNCAIERGGGLACWLEILRSLKDSPPERGVILIATSGHELGHLGLESFLYRHPDLPQKAFAWLHLGSSIGAALGWTPRLQTSDVELERMALSRFSDLADIEQLPRLEIIPTGSVRSGEALQIHRLGGRFVSIAGNHARFHLESDRWPESVDVDALEAYAEALVGLTQELSD